MNLVVRLTQRTRDDSVTVVATVSPAAPGAPRPETGRRYQAGLLAPGSLSAVPFPKSFDFSGLWKRPLRLQLRGQPLSRSLNLTPVPVLNWFWVIGQLR
jgi:hypothetical protein